MNRSKKVQKYIVLGTVFSLAGVAVADGFDGNRDVPLKGAGDTMRVLVTMASTGPAEFPAEVTYVSNTICGQDFKCIPPESGLSVRVIRPIQTT